MLPILIVLICALLFLQYFWIVSFPSRSAHSFARRFSRPAYKTLFLVLVLQVISGIFFPFNAGEWNGFISIAGISCYEIGVILAIWAINTLKGKKGTFVSDGPYAHSRNPRFIGLMLMMLGFSAALHSYFIILAPLLLIYFNRVAQEEEKSLFEMFGNEYKQYESKVRRWL
jgi:protein-S-isoprenylcysteine O-methyltransferase Ste14